MKVKNIKIYEEGDEPMSTSEVYVTYTEEDISFFHGVDAEPGYTPHIMIECDIYTTDDEEIALELWNEWLDSSNYRKEAYNLLFFESLAKKIKKEVK